MRRRPLHLGTKQLYLLALAVGAAGCTTPLDTSDPPSVTVSIPSQPAPQDAAADPSVSVSAVDTSAPDVDTATPEGSGTASENGVKVPPGITATSSLSCVPDGGIAEFDLSIDLILDGAYDYTGGGSTWEYSLTGTGGRLISSNQFTVDGVVGRVSLTTDGQTFDEFYSLSVTNLDTSETIVVDDDVAVEGADECNAACPYDDSLAPDDPACVAPTPCEFDTDLDEDDPLCEEPSPCATDPNLDADDPACIDYELPPECEPCPTNPDIPIVDPACETGDTGDTGSEAGCNVQEDIIDPDNPELCNGEDDDGDGFIDEGAIDKQTYMLDLDGDGFAGSYTVDACSPPDNATELTGDCNDCDPTVSPEGPDYINGIDDDCDGETDEADIAFVAAWQCVSSDARIEATALEAEYVEQFLEDLNLGMDQYIGESEGSIDPNVDLTDYSMVLYTKCGWKWEPYNQGDVDTLTAALTGGAALFAFGDDMAFRQFNVTGSEPLTLLQSTSNNGTSARNSSLIFDTTSTHPAYAGPYGTPVDFQYKWDMDSADAAGLGEIVLATHSSFDTPVFLVKEDDTTLVRQATLLTSIYNANHGSPGSESRTNAEIVFKNVVTWLLGLEQD